MHQERLDIEFVYWNILKYIEIYIEILNKK